MIDPDRRLAISHAPRAASRPLASLWTLDAKMGDLLARGGNAQVSQIKLAWWREALEALDVRTPPAEPILEDLARHVLPQGVSGQEMAVLAEGWEYLTQPERLSEDALAHYACLRGSTLFGLGARLLGGSGGFVGRAGEGWALADLARRTSREDEARDALRLAEARLQELPRWPRVLRPLGMLAMLACRDAERGVDRIEPHGSPQRMLRMIRHRLTGC